MKPVLSEKLMRKELHGYLLKYLYSKLQKSN